jgi:hypothetical protein
MDNKGKLLPEVSDKLSHFLRPPKRGFVAEFIPQSGAPQLLLLHQSL